MSEKVMNNFDLRNIIFSYFRKKPEITCQKCKKVCVWNKKIIRKYIEIPILDYTIIYYQCTDCYWDSTLLDFM
jgi:hypothetical protein